MLKRSICLGGRFEITSEDAIFNKLKKTFAKPPICTPILRRIRGVSDDVFTVRVVHRPVTADHGIFLAQVGPTPRGTIGINYVMVGGDLEREYGEERLFRDAFDAFQGSLMIDAMDTGEGMVFHVKRAQSFAASAIGMANFAQNAKNWTKAGRILVAVPNLETLYVTDFDKSPAQVLLEGLQNEEARGAVDFDPCAFLITGPKIETYWIKG